MQRQKSILSFLLKPSPENQDSGDHSSLSDSLLQQKPAKAPLLEIRGADTPPDKIRQSFFRAADADDSSTPSPFSNIMHKFAREQDGSGGGSSARRKSDNRASLSSYPKFGKLDEPCINMKSEMPTKDFSKTYAIFSDHYSGENPPDCEIFSNIMGPETPATIPLVPRLKRVHTPGSDVKHEVLAKGKRVKSIQDTMIGKMPQVEMSDSHDSKFEWLKPLYIRDGSGRRPCDSLYDRKTLYIPPDALKKMSATQKQYWSVKCQYMDVILFFKVGKFYELYELDAEIGHKELDWKMTISGVGKCRQVGISEAGIDDAVQKLIARGYKVGRIEQLETSDQAKARGGTSVIERKLVHVSTPSTTVDGNMGPNAVHLLALKEDLENGSPRYGFAFLDYAALKFWVGSICDDASCAALGALLMQVSPKEVVYESSGFSKDAYKALVKYASAGSISMQLTPTTPNMNLSDPSEVRKQINYKQYFRGSPTALTSAFENTEHHDLILCALGALVGHLNRLMLDDALLNGELLPYHVYKSCLRMDGSTLVNLEIFSNNVDGSSSGTLYKHLDHCITSSGKRLLWRWICHPLKNIDEINDRLNIVEGLTKQSGVVSIMTSSLRRLSDLERLLGRVKATVGSSSTLLLPFVGVKLLKQRIKAFGTLVKGLRIGIDLLICLQKEDWGILSLAKVVNIPVLSELDTFLKQFEAALEDDFPQYQDHNVKDSDAESLAILVDLFNGKSSEWSLVIHALNCIDVLQSFANTAISSCGSMSRPILVPAGSHPMISQQKNKGSTLKIKGLWHPYAVGESGNGLVPNDIYLGGGTTAHHPRALLLTGPNMGGKSTLLRATCLAVILAQIGCYVPCDMCMLSPADIIFTRLGATDRIMSGESTFFVECSESASVLQHATQDSLVLLDELGRGTSTFDGYAIAYAVFRHLVETICCRLLFATHYHPLTKEFATHPQVSLQHMACSFTPKSGMSSSFDGQSGQQLVFLYKLASGACPESYGLQVACIAGIPPKIVEGASKASQRLKHTISGNFKSSEERCSFSSLHEEWLKTLLALSKTEDSCWSEDDSDTLLCLWHEMKGFYGPNGNGN